MEIRAEDLDFLGLLRVHSKRSRCFRDEPGPGDLELSLSPSVT